MLLQIWCSFSAQTEEEQLQVAKGNHSHSNDHSGEGRGQEAMATPTPEQKFGKIDFRIRAILHRNRHLPRVSGVSEIMPTLLAPVGPRG